MSKIIKYLLLFSLLKPQGIKEDNFIIKFHLGELVHLEFDYKRGYSYSNLEFDSVCKNFDILKIEKMFVDEVGEMGHFYRVWLQNPNPDIENIIQSFNNIQCVDFAEGEIEGQLLQQNHPNDPLYNYFETGTQPVPNGQEQWYLYNDGDMNDDGTLDGLYRADIYAPEAWTIQTGRSDVILSFSDSGIMWDHPDLEGQIWINNFEDGNGNGIFDPELISDGGDFGDVNGDGCPGDCGVDDDGDGLADFQDVGVMNIFNDENDDDGDYTWKDGYGFEFNDSPGVVDRDDDADVTARWPELRNQASLPLNWAYADLDSNDWWDFGEPRPCDTENNTCDHPESDLWRNIKQARGLIKTDTFDNIFIDDYDGAMFDDDENGYVDDVIGYDFYNIDPDPIPEIIGNHGTAVAGDMIAKGNNGLFTSGIMWNGKIMTTKISSEGSFNRTSEGIYYCARNNANIHNMSWMGANPSEAINFAYNNKNVLLFASADNLGDNEIPNPAAHNNVLAVAGLNSYDQKHTSSNYGHEVELCAAYAPITYLNSNGDAYYNGSGTSHSSPIVAGVAGLVISEILDNGNTNYTNEEVRNILNATADDISYANQGQPWENLLGNGRVNAFRALAMANGPPPFPSNFHGTGNHGDNPFLHWDVVTEPDVDHLLLKRTVVGDSNGNHTFIISKEENGFIDDNIIIDKFSQVIIKYELKSVDIAGLSSPFSNQVTYQGEGLWKEIATQNNYDTLYYYNRNNLIDSSQIFSADISDGGTYFSLDSGLTYNISKIKFTMQSEFRTYFPYTFTFYIKHSLNDSTPGDLITPYSFTIIDSTYLFPNWFIFDLDTISAVKNLSGNFWITGHVLTRKAVHDGINDPSGHTFLHHQDGWRDVLFDIALEVIIEHVNININEEDEFIPISYSLEQNYPNPFNAKTKIPLNISDESEVVFSIYDLNGHLIKQYKQHFSPGRHFIEWNGKNMNGIDAASGIYFYNALLKTKETTVANTRKMLLLR